MIGDKEGIGGMEVSIDRYAAQAEGLLSDGRVEEAVVVASLCAMLAPDSMTARLLHARMLIAAGRGEEALTVLEPSVADADAPGSAHAMLADALVAVGEYSDALAPASEAVLRDRQDPDACGRLGDLLVRLGHVERGVLCLADAVRLSPEDPDRYCRLAAGMLALGGAESAAELYAAAAAMPDYDPAQDVLRALALIASGEADRGIETARASVERHRAGVAGYILLGCAMRSAGRHDEAVSAFEMACVLDPPSADAIRLVSAAMEADPAFRPDRILGYVMRTAATQAEDLDLTERMLRIPGLFDRALEAVLDPGARLGAGLDLWATSGLVGVVLGARCDSVTGVDPSPDVLLQASARGVYQRLHAGQPARFLLRDTSQYDLVASAEGLGATEDPAPLVQSMGRRLAPGGLLLVAYEMSFAGASKMVRPGRFAHPPGAVASAAQAAGLEPVRSEDEILFTSDYVEIPGMIAVFRRFPG